MHVQKGNPSPAMAIAMYVLVYAVLASLLVVLLLKVTSPLMAGVWSGLVLAPTLAALLWMDARDHGWRFADVMGPFPYPAELLEAVIAGISLPLLGLAFVWLSLLTLSAHSPDFAKIFFLRVAAEAPPRGAELVMMILAVTLIAPIFEEIAFRGILLRSWAAISGERRGLFWSALCFGLAHGATAPLTFLYGLVLGKMYLLRRSLIACMVCHVVINIVAATFTLGAWAPQRSGPGLELFLQQGSFILPLGLLGLAGTIFTLWRLQLLPHYFRRPAGVHPDSN